MHRPFLPALLLLLVAPLRAEPVPGRLFEAGAALQEEARLEPTPHRDHRP